MRGKDSKYRKSIIDTMWIDKIYDLSNQYLMITYSYSPRTGTSPIGIQDRNLSKNEYSDESSFNRLLILFITHTG